MEGGSGGCELKEKRKPNRGLKGGERVKGLCLCLFHYPTLSPAGQKALIKTALAGTRGFLGNKKMPLPAGDYLGHYWGWNHIDSFSEVRGGL